MVKFKNLTPDQIIIFAKPISPVIDPSGYVASVQYSTVDVDVCGTPVTVNITDDDTKAVWIPDPEDGVMYIVSNEVAKYCDCKGRSDLFTPIEPVKTTDGRTAYMALKRLWKLEYIMIIKLKI